MRVQRVFMPGSEAESWTLLGEDRSSAGSCPPLGPIIGVCDGGSVMGEQLRAGPPHRWQRPQCHLVERDRDLVAAAVW